MILQVASLRDTIAKKDAEIDCMLSLKPGVNGERRVSSSLRYGSPSSPRRHSIETPQQTRRVAGSKILGRSGKAASDGDNCSEYSDRHSEAGSQQSADESRHQKDLFYLPSNFSSRDIGPSADDDVEILGLGEGDSEERLSDISDGGLSMGTETDGSVSSVVEYTLFPETTRLPGLPQKSENSEK